MDYLLRCSLPIFRFHPPKAFEFSTLFQHRLIRSTNHGYWTWTPCLWSRCLGKQYFKPGAHSQYYLLLSRESWLFQHLLYNALDLTRNLAILEMRWSPFTSVPSARSLLSIRSYYVTQRTSSRERSPETSKKHIREKFKCLKIAQERFRYMLTVGLRENPCSRSDCLAWIFPQTMSQSVAEHSLTLCC